MADQTSPAPAVAFFDVDGTLTCRDFNTGLRVEPRPRVQAAIRSFVARGNVAVVSSGRCMDGLVDLLDLPFSGFVTLDGAHVILDGRVVADQSIPDGLFRRTVEEVRRVGMEVLLEGPYGACVVTSPIGVVADLGLPELEDYEAAGGRAVFGKIDFDETSMIAYERSDFLRRAYEYLNVGDGYHELVLPGTSKGAGARALIAELPFVPSRTYAFGDSENDLPLLDMVDVAVVMGNARDVVKRHADYVTDDVRQDGVATAMEHLGLA